MMHPFELHAHPFISYRILRRDMKIKVDVSREEAEDIRCYAEAHGVSMADAVKATALQAVYDWVDSEACIQALESFHEETPRFGHRPYRKMLG